MLTRLSPTLWGHSNGLVGSIGVQKDAAIFPALNTYCEEGKVLGRDEFGDHRLKKLDLKVTIQISNDLMKELVVKKETEWRPGYWIYDKKTVQMNNRNFGGAIKFYEQFKLEKGEYEMFDELYKKINTKGTIITVEGIPRDAQIDYSNKREADRFNDLSERVNREVKVTVAK